MTRNPWPSLPCAGVPDLLCALGLPHEQTDMTGWAFGQYARGDMIGKSYSGTPRRAKFLITIDIEGDNLWSHPATIETRNARFIPRFQELCERHGLKPTYLANHEMAMSDEFVAFGRDVLRRNAGEIGMHLHAWNSPPDFALAAGGQACHPYLVEYPEAVLRDKVATMTDLLEDRFAVKMRSHRAGRWAPHQPGIDKRPLRETPRRHKPHGGQMSRFRFPLNLM